LGSERIIVRVAPSGIAQLFLSRFSWQLNGWAERIIPAAEPGAGAPGAMEEQSGIRQPRKRDKPVGERIVKSLFLLPQRKHGQSVRCAGGLADGAPPPRFRISARFVLASQQGKSCLFSDSAEISEAK